MRMDILNRNASLSEAEMPRATKTPTKKGKKIQKVGFS